MAYSAYKLNALADRMKDIEESLYHMSIHRGKLDKDVSMLKNKMKDMEQKNMEHLATHSRVSNVEISSLKTLADSLKGNNSSTNQRGIQIKANNSNTEDKGNTYPVCIIVLIKYNVFWQYMFGIVAYFYLHIYYVQYTYI